MENVRSSRRTLDALQSLLGSASRKHLQELIDPLGVSGIFDPAMSWDGIFLPRESGVTVLDFLAAVYAHRRNGFSKAATEYVLTTMLKNAGGVS